ncbi:MAG: Lrp/AsnC family transcriptional regulator [Ruminococcaceae bacterium]|nr:Lrp/AsnC family transcriptional regulator [Oscillospiraceae bacterium]
MNIKLLKLLEQNARYSVEQLASMLGSDEALVKKEIKEMEKAGLICGYKTVIDWEKLDSAAVSALIELKVSPQADYGFEEIAKRVMMYDEVESVYLMSGGYDLCVMVRAKTFQQVAMFVAKELSTIDAVVSTATHFILRRYKEQDVILVNNEDDRGNFLL